MNIDDKVKTWHSTMTFDYQHCFLCGEKLDDINNSLEHVFPKWLQRRHDLWNQSLTLPNKSMIKYRQLTVPCCKKCNNEYLSDMEKRIETAFSSGADGVRNLDSTIIYKWVMKIFYSLMYKDLSLRRERGSQNSEMIMTPDVLAQFRFMFDCMQSIRKSIKLDERFSSLFIFDVHRDIRKDARLDFFYVDDILHWQIALQSDNVGIICCIGDNKVIERRHSKYFKPFYEMKLNPIQFRQLIADVFYTRTLLKNGGCTVMMPYEIVLVPSFNNVYKEYNFKEYAVCLFYLLQGFGIGVEEIYDPILDATLNLLIDKDRRIIMYDKNGIPRLGDVHEGYSGELYENSRISVGSYRNNLGT
jgi:hypothetical protein